MIKINKEFQTLIPPLTNEEYSELEKSIIAEGCRDSIVLWNDTIIDGHNRFEICTKHKHYYKTISKDFADINRAKEWVILNQFGRRNLSVYDRAKLALRLKEMFAGKAKENSLANLQNTDVQKSAPRGKTRDNLAKVAGVSHDTIDKVERIEKEATKEIKEKLSKGEISINEAHKEITAGEKEKKLEAKKAANLIFSTAEIQDNKPEIKLMDCIEYLNEFKNNSIDLLFTDPPYSTDISDIKGFVKGWLPLALSKVKPSGRVYICIGAYPIEVQAYLNELLTQKKFIIDNPLIWSYKNTLGVTPKMKYNLNYQMILHLYSEKSTPLDVSITNEMFSVMEINAPDGRQGDRFHTWQKPDELALKLIRHSTKEGDLVVDCFACTGTFLIAAAKMKRIAKGCDNNRKNLELANERGCIIITK